MILRTQRRPGRIRPRVTSGSIHHSGSYRGYRQRSRHVRRGGGFRRHRRRRRRRRGGFLLPVLAGLGAVNAIRGIFGRR